jgi:hypothetical protein
MCMNICKENRVLFYLKLSAIANLERATWQKLRFSPGNFIIRNIIFFVNYGDEKVFFD